jgi:hypothetical protein
MLEGLLEEKAESDENSGHEYTEILDDDFDLEPTEEELKAIEGEEIIPDLFSDEKE